MRAFLLQAGNPLKEFSVIEGGKTKRSDTDRGKYSTTEENAAPTIGLRETFSNLMCISGSVNAATSKCLFFIYERTVFWGHLGEYISRNQFIRGICISRVGQQEAKRIVYGTGLGTSAVGKSLSKLERLGVVSIRAPDMRELHDGAPKYLYDNCYTFNEIMVANLAKYLSDGGDLCDFVG